MVGRSGFEPPMLTRKRADLQSAATPPSLPPAHIFVHGANSGIEPEKLPTHSTATLR